MFDTKVSMADPTDLSGLREMLAACDPGGALRPIEMEDIFIQRRAVELLPQVVHSLTRGKRVLMVCDSTPIRRGEEDLKELVFRLLCVGFATEQLVLSSQDGGDIHADDANSRAIRARLPGMDCVVGVGSGTITDLCKEATYLVDPGIPLVIVQTALSVNAFSDGVAVMLKNNVKRTVPARYPTVLIVDLDVARGAPPLMNAAGYGDLIATWTAPADWYLANQIGMNPNFHSAPGDILRKQNYALLRKSRALANGEQDALDLLARVLTLSGLAMGIAGESSPASGTEHIISHLVDMSAPRRKAGLCYHGAQVSLGGILTAIAWDILLREFDPDRVDFDRCFPSMEELEPRVREAFSWLDDTGEAVRECWRDYSKKLANWHGNRRAFRDFLDNWDAFKSAVSAMVLPPGFICACMHHAGAPTRFSQLSPPVDPKTVRWALANCHLMRNRFTLADLLFYTGVWNESFVERLLREAEALNAGL